MKNTILVLVVMLFATVGYAQIKVVSPNGDTKIGDTAVAPDEKLHVAGNIKADEDVIAEGLIVERTGASGSALFHRTDASAFAMGAGVQAGFTWDQGFNFEWRTQPRANILNRQVSTGTLVFKMMGATGNLGIARNQPQEKLDVNGSIRHNGTVYAASDKRLKDNVDRFEYGLAEVLELNPITFQYTGRADINNGGKDRYHVGLYAQELQEVAPKIVSSFPHLEYADEEETILKSSEEYLQINETAIKFMLINAVQEHNEMLEVKEERISSLESEIEELKDLIRNLATNIQTENIIEVSFEGGTKLDQNVPNPFTVQTSISYTVPASATNAEMQFHDISGKLMKVVPLISGKGTILLDASELTSNTYTFTLYVDGKLVETKKMVVAK